MKYFYNEYKDNEKWQQAVAKLTWVHNVLLFEKIKDMDTRLKYIEGCIQNGWSKVYYYFKLKQSIMKELVILLIILKIHYHL